MIQMIGSGVALYKAVKWTLAGAQLMAHVLRSTTDYANNVTTLLDDARNVCADSGADPDVEELLAALATRADHLAQDSARAVGGAQHIEQVCQTVFRLVLVSPDSEATPAGFEELDDTVSHVSRDVEDMAETISSLTEGLKGVYDHLAHGVTEPSLVMPSIDQAVELMRGLSKLIDATRDALATATAGYSSVGESTLNP